MLTNERSLIDTNVLVYALYPNSEHYVASRSLLDLANDSQSGLVVTSQRICEFYSIITNYKRVSVPVNAEKAIAVVEAVPRLPGLQVIHTLASLIAHIMEILRIHPVRGRDVFDVQLVATMLENNVHQIYTFNRKDFELFLH